MRGKAGNIYENNIHVPLMIYHPEHPGGRTCEHVTSHLDLAPTFVDMATDDDAEMEEIKDGIKGYSLMPAVDNPKVDVRNGQGALFVYDMISMMDKNAIPTPVSVIRKNSSACCPTCAVLTISTAILPTDVNFVAFESRLFKICTIRSSSPIICAGTSGEIVTKNSKPFSVILYM